MRSALLALLFLLTSACSLAQNALPACDGDYVVVRLSQIKPGGSMKGFMDALAAHLAWYRSHGFKDNRIVAARIIERDPRSGELKYSEKQVMTYHFNPPGMGDPAGRGDAAWNAYVKLYRDNSDMLSETVTCMPRAGQ